MFSDTFHAPLVQTQGIDTLSGVLKRPDMSYRICRMVNEGIWPDAFRFAIVRGHLDVAIRSRDAARIDGPAFHTAADLIERAKRENLYYAFQSATEPDESDMLLTQLASVLHMSRARWTSRQRSIIELYEKLGSQNAVAGRLHISQQAVSDALVKSCYREISRADEAVTSALSGATTSY